MKWRPNVDLVAFILAMTLGVTVTLVVLTVIVQIIVTSNNPVLSGAAAQVIDSALTGIIGVLGSYVGYKLKSRDEDATRNRPPDEK